MSKTRLSSYCTVVDEITGNKWNHTNKYNVINQGTRYSIEDIYRVFDIDTSSRVNKRTIRKLLDM